jgi:hypothetical protein
VVIGLGTSIAGIINHVVAWKWFYISLFIIGAYGEGIVRWQPNGQREYDAINTEFVQPQYNAVVINIGNAIRIAYDASWCWYNTYVVGYRDIPKARRLFFCCCPSDSVSGTVSHGHYLRQGKSAANHKQPGHGHRFYISRDGPMDCRQWHAAPQRDGHRRTVSADAARHLAGTRTRAWLSISRFSFRWPIAGATR